MKIEQNSSFPIKQWKQSDKSHVSFFEFLSQVPKRAFQYFFQPKPFGITKRNFQGVEITMGGIVQKAEDGQLYVKASDEQIRRVFDSIQNGISHPLKLKNARIPVVSKKELQHLASGPNQAGKIVRFDSIDGIEKKKSSWVLKVKSKDLQEIRKQLGLKPLSSFHIVIAESVA